MSIFRSRLPARQDVACLLIYTLLLCIYGLTANTIAGDLPVTTFDSVPGWESFRNRLLPPERPWVRQDFGYQRSNHAGGSRSGEIGGQIHRDHTRATYAKRIVPNTLNDRLSASGQFAVTDDVGSSGVLIGWFNDQHSLGWRTPQSLAMRIDGNGGNYRVYYEYGTQKWGTHGGGAFDGPRYQTTSTAPLLADGSVHYWKIDYDPMGADGLGLLTFTLDDTTWDLPLLAGHREQGATFDRFGIWSQQTSGSYLKIYFDDLVVNGELLAFDTDPDWIGSGNKDEYRQQIVRPFHDFGFSVTDHTGGPPGEIGGIMFRDESPAYFADHVQPLTLNDELRASGVVTLRSAGADSGVLLGWFNAAKKRNKSTPDDETPQTDLLGIMIEGPSRVGHFFRPAYATSKGSYVAPTLEGTVNERPVLPPNESIHRWSLHYQPEEANGRGKITVTFDDKAHELVLSKGHRVENAEFDRFGVFNIQSGGHHVELYLDDMSWTQEPGQRRP